jgi:hypothetical protein
VVRTFTLSTSPGRLFAAFSAEMGRWWPRAFTTSGEQLADVVLEGRAGGRLYEVDRTGRKTDWATVRVWEVPSRLVLAWGLGLEGEQRTELELRFGDEGAARRFSLEHRGFRVGEGTRRRKFDSPGGWDAILEALRRHLADSPR